MFYTLSASAAAKAKKDFFISEIQTHTTSPLSPGSEVTPERLYSWVWSGFAAGARGLQLWRWRPFLHGYQSTGRGVTHIDGTPGARAHAMKKVSAVLNDNKELFKNSRPVKPAVKIVTSYRSRLFFDAFLSRPKPIGEWVDSFHPQTITGWYRLFWSSAVPTAFTELKDLSSDDMQTPVLVLPSLISLSKDQQKMLAEYVRSGGILIADARCGTVDDDGVVPAEGIPGNILSEVFGFKEIDVDEPVEFEFCGEKIKTSFMSQLIEPAKTAKIIGDTSSGRPVAVSNKFGKGQAIYFAGFMGPNFAEHVTENQKNFFLQKVLSADKNTPWAEKSDNLTISFHSSGNKNLVYIINNSDKQEKAILHNIFANGFARDIISGCDIPTGKVTKITVAGWQTQILILDIIK